MAKYYKTKKPQKNIPKNNRKCQVDCLYFTLPDTIQDQIIVIFSLNRPSNSKLLNLIKNLLTGIDT